MQKLTQEKVRKIKELTENGKTYVETAHSFIKGWSWFITDYLPEEQIGVIVLTREKEKIVKSLLRIGSTPIRMKGRSWIATPEKKNPLIPPPNLVISPKFTYILMRVISFPLRVARKIIRIKNESDALTLRFIRDYELRCLHWYIDETMAESEKYMELHPKSMFYKVDVSHLNNYQAVVSMLDYFALKAKDSIRNVIGKPVNLKLDENQ